jgi:hypothetical protein
MAKPRLHARLTLGLLTVFALITILVTVFPTRSDAKSVYRVDTNQNIIPDSDPDNTASSPTWLKMQEQIPDDYLEDATLAAGRKTIDSPPRMSTLNVINSILRGIWHSIFLSWKLLSFLLRPLYYIAGYVLDKIIFLLQPFIILATGFYTLIFVWPSQLIAYLARTFYPLYVFLACASIVGLFVGGVASITSSYLNNALFPHRPALPAIKSRPVTAESPAESLLSSGTATPAPHIRAPPQIKYSSSVIEDSHYLDTNALFTSFALPVPPVTPPVLYYTPTPGGSVSGVVGETIFEEEDDSDEKPVLQGSWMGPPKPLSRPKSAHGRMTGSGATAGMGNWQGKVKREDVAGEGVDWEDGAIRRRRKNVAAS